MRKKGRHQQTGGIPISRRLFARKKIGEFPRIFLRSLPFVEKSIERSVIQSCDDIGISRCAVGICDAKLPLFTLSRSELRTKSAPRKLQTLVGTWTNHSDAFRVKLCIFQQIEISRYRIAEIVFFSPLECAGVSIFYVYRFALNHTAIGAHQAEEKASTAVDGEFGFVFSIIMCHLKERFLGLFLFFFSSRRNPLAEPCALHFTIGSYNLHRKVQTEG